MNVICKIEFLILLLLMKLNSIVITFLIFFQLNTPDEILSAYYSSKITCGPPQVYELSRILQFNKHCDLIK